MRRHVGRGWTAVHAHPVLAVFLLALVVRIAVAVVVYAALGGTALDDDATYWEVAGAIAEGNPEYLDGYAGSLYAKTRTFIAPLMTIRLLGGNSPLWGQLFVALLGAGTAAGVTVLAREALPTRDAVFTGLVVALLPSQALWSSLILKDAAVWLILVVLATLLAWSMRSQGVPLVVMIVGIFLTMLLLANLRQHSVVVACWTLMLTGWVGHSALRSQRFMALLLIAVVVPWISGLGPAGAVFVAKGGSVEERRAANAENAASAFAPGRERVATGELEERRQRAAALAETRTEIAKRLDRVDDPRRRKLLVQRLEALQAELAQIAAAEREAAAELARIRDAEREPGIAHLARGVSVMIAEPYPWDEGTSPSFRMAQAETIVWYPVLILAFLGLLPALRRMRVTLFPLVFGTAIMLVYALVEGNVGTAYRHRGEFVWVVALLAGFGLRQLISLFKG